MILHHKYNTFCIHKKLFRATFTRYYIIFHSGLKINTLNQYIENQLITIVASFYLLRLFMTASKIHFVQLKPQKISAPARMTEAGEEKSNMICKRRRDAASAGQSSNASGKPPSPEAAPWPLTRKDFRFDGVCSGGKNHLTTAEKRYKDRYKYFLSTLVISGVSIKKPSWP